MDLGAPFGYESYSNRLDPHDEVEDSYAEKAFCPDSDQTVLLRRRHKRRRLDENSMVFSQNAFNLVDASNRNIRFSGTDGSYSNSSRFASIIARRLATHWLYIG
ncbi:hypothetical protein FIE12Z_1449 [Fusarium flagelliforme]|uniref:Uncharacterized protein n=1 Tax=Fusarium flagelliforme TaxID=2675880 RepID=A0A395N3E4_9HYPO|nr:hypothetical protein FIE12Z_1449 [Fusarium flagelliforme]